MPAADGLRGLYLAALAACNDIPALAELVGPFGSVGPIAPTWKSTWAIVRFPSRPVHRPLGGVWLCSSLFRECQSPSEPFTASGALLWAVLLITVYFSCHRFPHYRLLPGIILVVQGIAWMSTGFEIDRSGLSWHPSLIGWTFEWLYMRLAAGWFMCWGHCYWFGRALLLQSGCAGGSGAFVLLALAYFLATDHSSSALWSVVGLAIGGLYAATGTVFQRRGDNLLYTWCVLGCSGAYSLAAAMFFSEAGLTVALALQAVPLAGLRPRSGATNLLWGHKGSFGIDRSATVSEPLLETYSSGTHWAIWAYCSSTIAALLQGWVARPRPSLQRWD